MPTRCAATRRCAISSEAPQLPTGYAGMILAAIFPPVWRRVMDHRLLEHYDGDLTRVNIHPRAHARVLARYGPRA